MGALGLYSIEYKLKAPSWMGAFALYGIEYKIKGPMLDGSLGFVLNSIQNRGSYSGW